MFFRRSSLAAREHALRGGRHFGRSSSWKAKVTVPSPPRPAARLFGVGGPFASPRGLRREDDGLDVFAFSSPCCLVLQSSEAPSTSRPKVASPTVVHRSHGPSSGGPRLRPCLGAACARSATLRTRRRRQTVGVTPHQPV